jgi:hypothetical protein
VDAHLKSLVDVAAAGLVGGCPPGEDLRTSTEAEGMFWHGRQMYGGCRRRFVRWDMTAADADPEPVDRGRPRRAA